MQYEMVDSQGTKCKMNIDLNQKGTLDRLASHVIKYINEKEKLMDSFKNFK